ncbi:MAG: RNA-guided endonuclease InsQ/TnpB family protein [Beijerinckiaceae bacterium]
MLLTYKYRIKNRSTKTVLRRHAFAVNQVWNYCCAQQRDVESRYRAGAKLRKWASHYDLQKLCKGAGAMFGVHQQTVGGVCRTFVQSRDKLKHAPAFRKSYGMGRSLGWVPFEGRSRQVKDGVVTYLGKRFYLWGTKRRPIPATARGGCFVEDALGRWYVCITVEAERHPAVGKKAIGIDLGLKSLAALSDGRKIEAPQFYRRYEQKLAMAQRAGNRQRAKRLHAKIKECRKDFLHKVSTELTSQNAIIVVGNVNASALASKSVFDAGWSSFRNMLRYKAREYQGVDEKFTTVTCSACGSRCGPQGQRGLRVRTWECSACGVSHDRDVNAARNILAFARGAARPAEENRRAA